MPPALWFAAGWLSSVLFGLAVLAVLCRPRRRRRGGYMKLSASTSTNRATGTSGITRTRAGSSSWTPRGTALVAVDVLPMHPRTNSVTGPTWSGRGMVVRGGSGRTLRGPAGSVSPPSNWKGDAA